MLDPKSNLRSVCKSIEEKANLIEGLKGFIKQRITSLPANPRAKKLGNGAFTLLSSHLGGNWSVGYHSFEKQYELVAEHVCAVKHPFDIWKKLNETLERGSVPLPGGGTQQLHPDVIANIREIMEEK